MIIAIHVVQAKAQTIGYRRMFTREGHEVADAHGRIMQVALHGAVGAWMKRVHGCEF
jgi:hypothetical protein